MNRQQRRRYNAQTKSRPTSKQINGTLPRSIPLLSYPSTDKGNALFIGSAGRFSEIHRNDPQHALGDLSFVVQNIEGEANTRDSIPHVDAQTLCYRYMLNNITRKDPSLTHINQQWRGATVAYALSPLLMTMYYANDAQMNNPHATPKVHSALAWVRIGADELIQDKTDELGQVIRGGYPSSNTDLRNISWQFLTLWDNGIQIPLLSFSSQLMAVPSASFDKAAVASTIFPWLIDNEFKDPLSMLSEETLIMLANWAKATLEHQNIVAAQALEKYRQELLNEAAKVKENQPFLEVWKTVIQALLLRDWVETGIIVVSTRERMKECGFADAMRHAPIDGGPLRDEDAITEVYPYAVFLHNRFLGFLNKKNALWLYDPGYLEKSPEYQRLSQVLTQQLRTDTGVRVAYQHQVKYLLHSFTFSASENKALNEGLSRDNINMHCVVTPVLHKMQPGERGILEEPFSVMSAVCRYYDGDGSMFTPSITVYKDRTSPIYVEKANNDWGSVLGYTGQNTTDCAFLPLTACGSTIIRNAQRMSYSVNLILKYDESGENIHLKLQMKNALILYEWEYAYPHSAILPGLVANMPSVCYWPNGAAHPKDVPWNLYYTYIHYHEDFNPVRYSSVVYDINGKRMSEARNSSIEQVNAKGLHFMWQTHETERFPSFCTMYENGQSIGCVMFAQPELFPPVTQNANLAVDFGTTSTTAAVALDTKTPHIVNAAIFSKSTLKWEMIGYMGQNWSVEQYIADGLNTSAGLGGSGAFYTALARFDSLIDNNEEPSTQDVQIDSKLFRNGHIYYFGESVHMDNPMGNRRFVGLKMKDLDNSHPWATSNVEMFLRQVLEMYALYCRQKGARIEKILFAYPMAFSKEKREQFQARISKVLRAVAVRTGMESCTLALYNESQAVSAYFSLIPSLAAANASEGCVTLDIGGGTVDYSFCALNAGRPSNARFDSCELGGQRLVGEYIYQCAVKFNQGKTKALDWFHEGFQAVSGNRDSNDAADIQTFLDDLLKLYRGPKSEFVFCIDHFISLRPAIFKEVLKTKHFQTQYQLFLFQLTLLLWFGYYLGLQGCAGNLGNVLRVYSAGNGSNLFKMIDDADNTRLMHMFTTLGGKALEVVPSRAPKREVVEGLLRMENYSPETTPLSCKDPVPEEIWVAFLQMLQEYVNTFPAADTVVIPYLKSILDDRQTQEDAKKRFLDTNKNLTQLCTHLPNICDIVISEMLEKL